MTLRSVEDRRVVVYAVLLDSVQVHILSPFLVRGFRGRSTDFAVVAGEDRLELIEVLIDGLVFDWASLLTLFSLILESIITELLHLEAKDHASQT